MQVESNAEWLEVLAAVEMNGLCAISSSTSLPSPFNSSFSSSSSPSSSPHTPPNSRYLAGRFSRSPSPCIVHPCSPFASAITPPSSLPWHREIHTPIGEDDGSYLVASKASICCLLRVLAEANGKCPICSDVLMLETTEMQRRGHTGRISFWCELHHEIVWLSSLVTNSKYLINLR